MTRIILTFFPFLKMQAFEKQISDIYFTFRKFFVDKSVLYASFLVTYLITNSSTFNFDLNFNFCQLKVEFDNFRLTYQFHTAFSAIWPSFNVIFTSNWVYFED